MKMPLEMRREFVRCCLNIQSDPGNWAYDEYMRGMYNGLEVAMAILDERDPIFKTEEDYKRINKIKQL